MLKQLCILTPVFFLITTLQTVSQDAVQGLTELQGEASGIIEEPAPTAGFINGISPQPIVQKIENEVAVFAGLDKITGRIIQFDVKINETVQFGALQVTPKVCHTTPTTQAPQTSGFIRVYEETLDSELKRLFSGWMFAESPGLNAVEHAVNDVWLVACKSADQFSTTPVTSFNQTQQPLGFNPDGTPAEGDVNLAPPPQPTANPLRG